MLDEIIAHYREEGAPGDQNMLIALLKEAQKESGPFTMETLGTIAQELGIKPTLLTALIRRLPSLRMADKPHRLEICQSCGQGRELRAWAEKAAQTGNFTYHAVPCMKNCQNGPSAKWDGELIPQATADKLKQRIQS